MVIPPQRAVCVYERQVNHQDPSEARDKLEAATIDREMAALELQEVTVGTDVTTLDLGPPVIVRRRICLVLGPLFFQLYPEASMREGVLSSMFQGSLSSQACADVRLASITLGVGGCNE
jgi:hypothetical protein